MTKIKTQTPMTQSQVRTGRAYRYRNFCNERGVTLVEATVVLAVTAILVAILAPAAGTYMDQARLARAREDVHVIGDALTTFIDDNGEHMLLRNGSNGAAVQTPPTRADANRVELLISDGDVPSLGNAVLGETYWTQTLASGAWVDTISNHLAENNPGETLGNRYRQPVDITITPVGNNIDFARAESSGFNAPYAWRGAYLRSPLDADPWGNRYSVNVAFLDPRIDAAPVAVNGTITSGFTTADYPRLDVFVISAGPDEEIDTKSAQDGAVAGDDDIIYVMSSNAK